MEWIEEPKTVVAARQVEASVEMFVSVPRRILPGGCISCPAMAAEYDGSSMDLQWIFDGRRGVASLSPASPMSAAPSPPIREASR